MTETWTKGGRVRRLCALAVAAAARVAGAQAADTWVPPIGIPAPTFGIVEPAPATPSPWAFPTPGFYYVEPSNPAAVDSGNPYGTPAVPRQTIPLSLPAGAVVEVHGAYGHSHVSPDVIVAHGTAAAPVFIRGGGATRPVASRPLHLRGSYFVVEQIDVALADPNESALKILSPTSHGVVRHCDLAGNLTGGGVAIGYSALFGGVVDQVVLFDDVIHDNGDVTSTFDQDVHAIEVGARSSKVWILDNVLRDSSGDGLQVNAGSAAEAGRLHHVYVGRNHVYGTRQAGLFTKQATHVVFSQNLVHDVIDTSWSPSKGLGFQYAPEDVWFLYNEVHDCAFGIYAGSDNGQGHGKSTYFVGNLIHGIHHTTSFNPDTAWSNAGIMLAGGTYRYVVHNTLYDVDGGINSPSAAGFLYIADNVVANVTEPASSHVFVEMGGVARASKIHHNLFDATARLKWGGATALDVPGLQAAYPGQCKGCVNADPLFVDAAAGDLRLQNGSPAADAGSVEPVYGLYLGRFGVNIAKDADAAPRPFGPAWDLGAHEWTGAPPPALSIGDATVVEGTGGVVTAVFAVTLSPASGQKVTVKYATENGTAVAGRDYVPLAGTLVFPPGTTSRTLSVRIVADRTVEANETFFVGLSNPTGALVADGIGDGTITTDEAGAPGALTSPTPGSTLTSASATFTWSAGVGVTQFGLEVGTTAGGHEIYSASEGTGRTRTVSGLPTDGSTVYVRLWSLVAGVWSSSDATYVASGGGGGGGGGGGASLYVDRQIGPTSCVNYDPASRSCGSGSATAYKTLQGGAGAATPGTTVSIRAGTYAESLVPAASGTSAQPITYTSYPGETATISGAALEPAVDISGRSYVILDGLTVTGVKRWLYALDSHYDVVRNCSFSQALDPGNSSKTGLFFQQASYNQIVDNTIEDSTEDNVVFIESDHNLLAGNTIRKAVHALWAIKCGNFNVVRNNFFENQLQKIGEIYDCDAVGFNHDVTLFNATKHNLVDANAFAYTPSSGDASPYDGIQYAGQMGIIRRNAFYDTVGPGIELTLYADEARYTTDNRIYNNVFYSTSFAGVEAPSPSSYAFSGNVLKNNIFFESVFVANDTRWPWYTDELAGKPVQFLTGRLDGFVFEGNDILGSAPGQTYPITYGDRASSSNPPQHTLAYWQQNQPAVFVGNLEVDPQFVNEATHDFHLQAASPLVDAGVPLTRTTAAGSGTSLVVADATYFYDGFGIPGEVGDTIQLSGTTDTARILAINYGTRTLTLDHALAWSADQGVALQFGGSAPDVGAFER